MAEIVEEFARRLVELVRDQAIRSCDVNLRPTSSNAIASRWRSVLASNESKEAFSTLLPDVVDEVIFQLLDAIDGGSIVVCAGGPGDERVDIAESGSWELSGWYASGDWPKRYSAERFHDYTADSEGG